MPDNLTVLGVWAHPDDESYGPAGTFRKLADEGVRTAVLVATRGQLGGIADPSIATPASLPEVREAELRDAAAILGIGDVAVLNYQDGQLMDTDVLELRGEVVRVIRAIKPDVVVTFGPAGVYGHPDHVQIRRVVTEAFTAAGNADNYPEHMEQGLAPYSPSKLYYLAVPEHVAGRISESGIIADHDSDITTTVDVRPYVETKLRAIRAHRSQTDFPRELEENSAELLSMEYFKRVLPQPETGEQMEHDLLTGLR